LSASGNSECALLLLRLIEVKGKERQREGSRLRIAEISLKRLWARRRISPEFAEEVAEWLSGADFTLFLAGTTYAVVKASVVENWPIPGQACMTALSGTILIVLGDCWGLRPFNRNFGRWLDISAMASRRAGALPQKQPA